MTTPHMGMLETETHIDALLHPCGHLVRGFPLWDRRGPGQQTQNDRDQDSQQGRLVSHCFNPLNNKRTTGTVRQIMLQADASVI